MIAKRIFALSCGILLLQVSTAQAWVAARTVFAPPISKGASFEFLNPGVNPPQADKKMSGMGVRITLINLSKISQTVRLTLRAHSIGSGSAWLKNVGHKAWNRQGFFLAENSPFNAASVVGASIAKGDTNCSTLNYDLPSNQVLDNIVIPPYDPSLISDNAKSLFVVFYQGGNLCGTNAERADFGKAACRESDPSQTCTVGRLRFEPQFVIEVKEDRGAIQGTFTLQTFGAKVGGYSFSDANTCSSANEGGNVDFFDLDLPIIMLNGGRPF